MAVFEKTFVQDLTRCITAHHCNSICFSADNDSVQINVDLYDGGEPATLSGSVTVYAIRADGETVSFAGSLSGNTASATLSNDCFAAPGPLVIMIQIVTGTVKTTVLKAVFTVEPSTVGDIIEPD